jgi:hypothetical protein
MRVRLDEALVVEHGVGRRHRDRLGGTGDVDDDPGSHTTGTERRAVVIAGPDDDPAIRREIKLVRDRRSKATDHVAGTADRRQPLRVETGLRHELVRPGATVDVVEQGR